MYSYLVQKSGVIERICKRAPLESICVFDIQDTNTICVCTIKWAVSVHL